MKVLLVALGLIVVPAAGAAESRIPQLTRAVAAASGTTNPDVSCETNDLAWGAEVRAVGAPPNSIIDGYTLAQRVRLAPWVCRNLNPKASKFGNAVYVVGVEAARVAGYMAGQEAMAGCWGLLWAADLARRVWGIRFFTPASNRIVAQALAEHRRGYPRYQSLCR